MSAQPCSGKKNNVVRHVVKKYILKRGSNLVFIIAGEYYMRVTVTLLLCNTGRRNIITAEKKKRAQDCARSALEI